MREGLYTALYDSTKTTEVYTLIYRVSRSVLPQKAPCYTPYALKPPKHPIHLSGSTTLDPEPKRPFTEQSAGLQRPDLCRKGFRQLHERNHYHRVTDYSRTLKRPEMKKTEAQGPEGQPKSFAALPGSLAVLPTARSRQRRSLQPPTPSHRLLRMGVQSRSGLTLRAQGTMRLL